MYFKFQTKIVLFLVLKVLRSQ